MRISFSLVMVLIIILSCCKKPSNETSLDLSKYEVSLEEPFIAKVNNAPANARYEWHIPKELPVLQYSADSSKVKLAFYRGIDNKNSICVTVYSNGNTTGTYCKDIKVDSGRVVADTINGSIRPLLTTGNQLTIKPVIYPIDSALSFILQASASNTCMNSYLVSVCPQSINNVTMSVFGMWVGKNCEQPTMPVTGFCTTRYNYRDGTFPVNIYFENILYTGSLTVSKFRSKFEFNWPYTSGVLIEPKVVVR